MKYIIIGGGGHAKVLIELIHCINEQHRIIGVVDRALKKGDNVQGIPVLGNDDVILEYASSEVRLVNGVGSVNENNLRESIFNRMQSDHYQFATLIHPTAYMSPTALISEGSVIMAGAVVQSNVIIGRNVIVNTRCSIDHDSRIGDHVHIAPGATISGNVHIHTGAFIGIGSSIIQGVQIGEKSLIGAGACVIRNVPDYYRALGVPAKCQLKPIKRK